MMILSKIFQIADSSSPLICNDDTAIENIRNIRERVENQIVWNNTHFIVDVIYGATFVHGALVKVMMFKGEKN